MRKFNKNLLLLLFIFQLNNELAIATNNNKTQACPRTNAKPNIILGVSSYQCSQQQNYAHTPLPDLFYGRIHYRTTILNMPDPGNESSQFLDSIKNYFQDKASSFGVFVETKLGQITVNKSPLFSFELDENKNPVSWKSGLTAQEVITPWIKLDIKTIIKPSFLFVSTGSRNVNLFSDVNTYLKNNTNNSSNLAFSSAFGIAQNIFTTVDQMINNRNATVINSDFGLLFDPMNNKKRSVSVYFTDFSNNVDLVKVDIELEVTSSLLEPNSDLIMYKIGNYQNPPKFDLSNNPLTAIKVNQNTSLLADIVNKNEYRNLLLADSSNIISMCNQLKSILSTEYNFNNYDIAFILRKIVDDNSYSYILAKDNTCLNNKLLGWLSIPLKEKFYVDLNTFRDIGNFIKTGNTVSNTILSNYFTSRVLVQDNINILNNGTEPDNPQSSRLLAMIAKIKAEKSGCLTIVEDNKKWQIAFSLPGHINEIKIIELSANSDISNGIEKIKFRDAIESEIIRCSQQIN